MEINHFASFNPEVEHDDSGTCSKPILAAIVPGMRGTGAIFIIKIEELFYEMQKNRDGKQWWTNAAKRSPTSVITVCELLTGRI